MPDGEFRYGSDKKDNNIAGKQTMKNNGIEITSETIRHTAKLSRIKLTEEEEKGMEKHFASILKQVETLDKFDASSVPATAHILSAVNVLREDVPGEPFDREKLLACAPERDENSYVVPRVVE